MKSYIKCVNVEYESSRVETFYDIQLNVKGKKDLLESFDDYIQVEMLDGENKYQSEKYGLQDAKKGVIFTEFPPVLHLQLKRFEYDFQRDQMVKVWTKLISGAFTLIRENLKNRSTIDMNIQKLLT